MTDPNTTKNSTTASPATDEVQEGQNFLGGFAAGLAAAVVGAILWAMITVVTEFQIGLMAIGVGFLVGFAVRKFGNGSAASFGVLGGFLSLVGCLAGNYLSTIGFISKSESMPFFQVLEKMPLSTIPDLMMQTFSAMDLVFYAIAVYEGYKLALRPRSAP